MRNFTLAALCVLCGIAACHRAESPATVDKDIAAPREKAANDTEKAKESAETKLASARAHEESAEQDAAHVSAVQSRKVADTEAAGARNVALAACEGLSGTAQKSCRDKAEADYQVAKARAEQLRASTDPKP